MCSHSGSERERHYSYTRFNTKCQVYKCKIFADLIKIFQLFVILYALSRLYFSHSYIHSPFCSRSLTHFFALKKALLFCIPLYLYFCSDLFIYISIHCPFYFFRFVLAFFCSCSRLLLLLFSLSFSISISRE